MTIERTTFLVGALLLWEDRATLHLVAEDAISDRETDARHEAAIEAWARGGRSEPLPEHPVGDAFHRLRVTVDAPETTFESRGTAVGGSGTEWQASVLLRVHGDARRRDIAVGLAEDGRAGDPVTIVLPPPPDDRDQQR